MTTDATATTVQPEAAPSRYMNDDVVAEILLRLPSDAVLRFRTVCKAWRRITASPAFRAAHSRRRPLELIVQRHGANGVLDTIPAATLDETRRRCLHVRYPKHTGPPVSYWSPGHGHSLVDSCDGLLVFERAPDLDLCICNPITRQWAMLPRPPPTDDGIMVLCGFYLHRPSGEHRLLFLTDDQQGSHYICSLQQEQVAAGGARRLGPAVPVVGFRTERPLRYLNHCGKLHWLHHPDVIIFPTDNAQQRFHDKILAFDTVSETFRRLSPPPRRSSDRYFGEEFSLMEMDGKLAMTDILKGSVVIWVLEDYNNDKSWTRRHRVDLPPSLRRARWAMSSGQNVILVGDTANRSVGLYDLTSKRLLKQIHFSPGDFVHRTVLNALVFRDNLERHAFFDLHGPIKSRPLAH